MTHSESSATPAQLMTTFAGELEGDGAGLLELYEPAAVFEPTAMVGECRFPSSR